jgi:hypothetical protein
MLLVLINVCYGDSPFIPNIKVSDDTGYPGINQGESDFALFGENIYAICNTAERSFIPMIPFARSQTGGLTWDTNIPWKDESTGIIWHSDPVIMTDRNGGVHMLILFAGGEIRHYLSTDGGNTWIDSSDVSDPATGGSKDKEWGIIRNDTIYVVWQEFGGSGDGVRFARSVDNGATFQRSTIDPTRYGLTAIDVDDNGILYLIYIYGGMYFTKSYNNGDTWTSSQYLSSVSYSDGIGDRAPIPSIAVYGDSIIFITWVDSRYGNWDILGMKSPDGGNTWTGPSIVNDSMTGGQCKAWADFDPYGGLHVQYYHTPDWPTTLSSLWSVRYRYSTDYGAIFEPSIRLTDTVFLGYYYNGYTNFLGDYHTIETDSDYVYSVWTDGRDGNMNLYFTRAAIEDIGIEDQTSSTLPISVRLPTFITNTKEAFMKISAFGHRDVEITAYDISGRRLHTLFSGTIVEPIAIPLHKYTFPQGVVFFRLKAGNYTKTYKSIHLRLW